VSSAHVGQIDVVVAEMIPVTNVEAKVRHAAVLMIPQHFNPENSRLFVRLPELGRGAPKISKRSYVVKAALQQEQIEKRENSSGVKRPFARSGDLARRQ
jgi:hypothetical protein